MYFVIYSSDGGNVNVIYFTNYFLGGGKPGPIKESMYNYKYVTTQRLHGYITLTLPQTRQEVEHDGQLNHINTPSNTCCNFPTRLQIRSLPSQHSTGPHMLNVF